MTEAADRLADDGVLAPRRRAALDQALANDLPSLRSERWKYTSLRALAARRFSVDFSSADNLQTPAWLDSIDGPRLVFVNGDFSSDLSRWSADGTSFGWQPDWSDAPAGPFGRPDEVFAQLNSALERGGALVEVPDDISVDIPVHLVFLGRPLDVDVATHLRHRIRIGARARLTVVEHHLASGEHRHLDNHLLQVELGEGAELVHARIQDTADGATLVQRTDAVLASGAEYRRVDLELGAGLSRHELNVSLRGDGASLVSGGALLGSGRRHVDTRLGIEHVARDTRCDLRWRGLATDRGRVAFHGGILIREGADGSDAALSNKNLLLSDNAEIDTQPVLEIHADEVKAAHGATVGRLDPTALFYLRSRGIDEAQARALLTQAFLREALSPMPELAAIDSLTQRIEARLATIGTQA
ncbi:Fe-S cluster assembly protein SufD [Arenimonas sp.]|uniref:Fe-S cluster assembly protein SufD n=1 Tax=Arenimonas sp. TaxID=1872635 RepID=UPI0039E52000